MSPFASPPTVSTKPSRPLLTRSQVVPSAQQPQLPVRQSRQPAPRVKVPACTHTVMTRLYGAHTCHNCGRIPSIGWLYACRQDLVQPTYDLSTSDSADALPAVADDNSYFEAQAKIAASIGMSASVTKQMTAGAYTYDQIETLLAQRRLVIDTIKRTKHLSSASSSPIPVQHLTQGASAPKPRASRNIPPAGQELNAASAPMNPTGKAVDAPSDSPEARSESETVVTFGAQSPRKRNRKTEMCSYQVCHNCRPFFQDRLPLNMEPALNGADEGLAKLDISALPVLDATVVGNLGLRRHHLLEPLRRSEESMDITMHQRDGSGYDSFGQDTSSDWTPTTTTSSEADSDLSEKFDLSTCPGAVICPMWSATNGCAYDNGSEAGDRDINHGYIGRHHQVAHGLGISQPGGQATRATPDVISTRDMTPLKGSSISLPNLPTTPVTDETASTSCSCSLPDRSSPRSNKSSNSSKGSEVEVAGGLALTEEAVKTGTPDITSEEVRKCTRRSEVAHSEL